MVNDTTFTNGKYTLFYDPKDSEVLVGVSLGLRVTHPVGPSLTRLIEHEGWREIGKVTLQDGSSTTPFFHFEKDFYDQMILPLVQLAEAFERKDEYVIRRTVDDSSHFARKEGVLVSLRESFDFTYDSGLKKMARNLLVKGILHAIHYGGKVERPKGRNLDGCSVSNPYREEERLDFKTQLYGFVSPPLRGVDFNQFRDSPGSSGWDCDLTGAHHRGVKYHRISGSSNSDYSFKNGVGTFECALGILENAKGINLLSLEEALKRFG